MSLAQEEADRFLNEKPPVRGHPEDHQHEHDQAVVSDDDDNDNDSNSTSPRAARSRPAPTYVHSDADDDEDDDEYYNDNMISKPTSYHVPKTVYEANTGPKGVISDAQSYERARKRSFRRTLMNAAGLDRGHIHTPQQDVASVDLTQPSPDESDDERFMREWREARMLELQRNGNVRGGANGKRKYGTVDVVSANGYLDAVENAAVDAVVVVCVFDPEVSKQALLLWYACRAVLYFLTDKQSAESSIVEDCLMVIARKHTSVRFVKLHHEIADMEHVQAPALLAYKGGDVFATIVDIFQQLPNGRNCSAASLGDLLMLYVICPPPTTFS